MVEDRIKNVIIFGSEETGEDLHFTVKEVCMLMINHSSRQRELENQHGSDIARAVKVIPNSTTAMVYLLRKSKELKNQVFKIEYKFCLDKFSNQKK